MEQNTKEKWKNIYIIFRSIFIILLVVGAGIFAVNQTLTFFYKSHFLRDPCDLCTDLNTNQSDCINGCFRYSFKTYADGLGNFRDAMGQCWGLDGEETKCNAQFLPDDPAKVLNISNVDNI